MRKCIFLVQVQAVINDFQTFYWSSRTASPQFIQWTVGINRLWQLGSVHKIHIHLEATSPFAFTLFKRKVFFDGENFWETRLFYDSQSKIHTYWITLRVRLFWSIQVGTIKNIKRVSKKLFPVYLIMLGWFGLLSLIRVDRDGKL